MKVKNKMFLLTICIAICVIICVVVKIQMTGESEEYENPYVQAYMKEKEKTHQDDSTVADAKVEEDLVIQGLKEYYEKDVEVANIL